MKGVVAVEGTLSPVAEVLRTRGYEVVDTEGDLTRAQAVVISGTDDNLMGMEDMVVKAPVINAEGMTTEEIVQSVEEKLDLER